MDDHRTGQIKKNDAFFEELFRNNTEIMLLIDPESLKIEDCNISANEFAEIADHILESHERWDGCGYPKGLKGEEISLEARIIAIADAYDAMTKMRFHMESLTVEEAIEEINRCSGTQFDPEIARVFIDIIKNED